MSLSSTALDRFLDEFSGSQRQRIGIARAFAMEARMIVADESVAVLKVSVEGRVVNLFADLRVHLGLTCLFITHDLGVVRRVSTWTAVINLGPIVETGKTYAVFDAPVHSYTAALISAILMANPRAADPHRPLGRDPKRREPAEGLQIRHPLPRGRRPLPRRAPGAVAAAQGPVGRHCPQAGGAP